MSNSLKVERAVKRYEREHDAHSFTIDTPHRVWLEAAYKTNAVVQFKGTVERLTKKTILFKALYIRLDYMDGGTIDEGCEEHVWVGRNHTDDVGGAQPFHNAGIQVGDTVSFEGDVFLYRRRDKTFDYAIENCRNIVKIQPYSLPTQEQLLEQELGHLVCETCLYSSQCYGEPCLAPEGYREQAIKNLKEILQEDNERHSAYPNDKDRQYMDGLRSAVMKHIERTIAKARDDEPREEECERFYRYVESIMTSPAVGEWWFIKEDIPDYPFSPVCGTVFVFEYEGETAYYGWDADRGEIGFYSLPKHLELSQKEFILMEDILNEPIGVSTT